MSPQETQSLQDFLNQLVQVRGIAKDPQADALIAGAVAQQPDAAYLLVQRALLMEQALTTAKTQIASLQNQIQATQAAPARSFFDPNAWGNTSATAPRPVAPPMMANMPTPMSAAPMQNQMPAASPGFFSGGVGSALGTVAATAAGVAGGAFLFQGIEHLMHPGSGSSGAAGFMNQPGMVPSTPSTSTPAENTTVNNYYDGDAAKDDSTSTDDTLADDMTGDDDSSII